MYNNENTRLSTQHINVVSGVPGVTDVINYGPGNSPSTNWERDFIFYYYYYSDMCMSFYSPSVLNKKLID